MLRRDPTSIEIQDEDLVELKKARDEKFGAAKSSKAAPQTPVQDSSTRQARALRREQRLHGQ